MPWTSVWLIVALIAGIVEILVPIFGFIFVSFAAVAAALAALAGMAPAWQVVLFAGALFFSMAVLRPVAQRALKARGVPSRTDALVGRRGQVIQAIDPVVGTGRVNVGGDDWAARSPAPVAAGSEVVVDGADGIVLLVSPAVPSHPPNAKEAS